MTLADLAIVKIAARSNVEELPDLPVSSVLISPVWKCMEMCGKESEEAYCWGCTGELQSSQLACCMTICCISSEAKMEGWQAQQSFMQK